MDELLHSCWIIEAARAGVLDRRGHRDSAARSRERAEIIARRCTENGVTPVAAFAEGHSEWTFEVAGTEEQTGPLGWFFLQRLGNYVEVHLAGLLTPGEREALADLGGPDSEEVAKALEQQGLPPPPPPEFPETPEVHPPSTPHTRIGVIGDPHIGVRSADRIIPVVVEDLNREGVDVTVIIGDITQNGQEAMFVTARETFERLDSPWLVTLGNHDMWGYDTDRPVGMERFKKIFEREPYGIFENDRVRVIAIDSSDPTPSPFPPYDLTAGQFTSEPNEAVPGGRISEEMAEWMGGVEPSAPTFVFLHHPPYPYLGFPPVVFGLDRPSTGVLAEFLERVGAWGAICGHTHRSVAYQLAGVPYLETISSKEWPFAYGILEVSDEGWSYNLRPVSDQEFVTKESSRYSLLHRRYIRGSIEARAFVHKI